MSSAWKLPILPVKPWRMTAAAVEQNCSFWTSLGAPGGDGLFGGFGECLRGNYRFAGVGEDEAPLLDLGAGEPNHHGTLDADLADRLGDSVAAVGAGEHVDDEWSQNSCHRARR